MFGTGMRNQESEGMMDGDESHLTKSELFMEEQVFDFNMYFLFVIFLSFHG
jgi:hypothetical protein